MSIEAMNQALEALELATPHFQADLYRIPKAITALRQAIEQAEQTGCDHCNHPLYAGTKCKNCGRVTEQAEQAQPLTDTKLIDRCCRYQTELTKAEQAQQPVANEPPQFPTMLRKMWSGSEVQKWINSNWPAPPRQPEPLTDERVIECAKRLVEHADFKLGGVLSANSKAKDIPSKAVSQVKARHLAALRDALAAHGIKENT